MKNNLKTIFILCLITITNVGFSQPTEGAKQFKFKTTIEKERPDLDEETKRLIANYRKNPSEANLKALRKQVEANYEKVIERKKEKLEELRKEAKEFSKIKEMQYIVDEVVKDKENRIEQTMKRFTDPRLAPNSRYTTDGYLPVLGAAQNVTIAYIPVTNEDYFKFIKATGRVSPKDWVDGIFPTGKEQHPVVNVSYDDAIAYCKWLTDTDGKAVYRLPTEKEWELAAGHMPKDADFNCGENKGLMPVDTYVETLAACGAIDMWGNCWEWTSSQIVDSSNEKRDAISMVVKGGSWRSPRMSCRTENRSEARKISMAFNDVGFRIIREN